MSCPHRCLSYASWRLQIFRQIFLSTSELRSGKTFRRSISSTHQAWDSAPTQGKPKRRRGRPRRVDKSEDTVSRNDSTAETARPSQLLPQSPLITHARDPREKVRKKRASKEDIDRLRRNPWAVALASAPRMCSATSTRLPKAFLGDWGMVRRPNSDTLWFMPIGLLKDELKAAEAAGAVEKAENENKTEDESIGTAIAEDKATDSKSKTRDNTSKKKNRPLRLLTLRLLDRLLLIKECTSQFMSSSSSKKARLSKIIPFRWKYPLGPITSREEKNMVWREDMPSFVLKNMRKEAVKELEKVCWQDGNLNTADGVWRVIELREANEAALIEGLKGMQHLENMEWGGVLIMGPDSEAQSTSSSSGPETGEETSEDPSSPSPSPDPQTQLPHPESCSFASPFPDYVHLPQRGRKVPVFDLTVLLSDADRAELRRRHPRFRNNALFFRPGGNITVDAMLALWRLKGFVMHDEHFLVQESTLDG
ncbi:hypothetical protein VTN00DRAFT_7045 [Thermoascus crustaceus]|uniref:uncharacterized protein n=1 Tax=Thermoascus crustaceus TaxID=5088 RepID=UPI00374241CB